jgi:hypothetical protein
MSRPKLPTRQVKNTYLLGKLVEFVVKLAIFRGIGGYRWIAAEKEKWPFPATKKASLSGWL